ncbi:MAG: methylated-DNA--[protein]-cysteine S-methyltransferase [Anaerolineales bacterium]|nr:methylated-DNA--[protein]-cysteine S-methyltransferase [Anaerolineales bacterium]MCX7608658.1 methylated-DNA--[protein]-cysteine S-methyltransferase [Anaerolineales bacterium]MDW8226224.1 methylated-DNA--[protein]-cysteine S-methyltransferase [Anaerolineales bacterium]
MKEKSPLYFGDVPGTPLGTLWIAVSDLGLAAIAWGRTQAEFETYLTRRFKRPLRYHPQRIAQAADEVCQYLAGQRHQFTLPIDWSLLRPFQQAVLRATCEIPYGETRTYKQIAEQISRPKAARAVGRAEATNPMPLVIPCHRVIGTDGKLHGYTMGEGIETKNRLLKLEGAFIA